MPWPSASTVDAKHAAAAINHTKRNTPSSGAQYEATVGATWIELTTAAV